MQIFSQWKFLKEVSHSQAFLSISRKLPYSLRVFTFPSDTPWNPSINSSWVTWHSCSELVKCPRRYLNPGKGSVFPVCLYWTGVWKLDESWNQESIINLGNCMIRHLVERKILINRNLWHRSCIKHGLIFSTFHLFSPGRTLRIALCFTHVFVLQKFETQLSDEFPEVFLWISTRNKRFHSVLNNVQNTITFLTRFGLWLF